jgi:hypothetical protein
MADLRIRVRSEWLSMFATNELNALVVLPPVKIADFFMSSFVMDFTNKLLGANSNESVKEIPNFGIQR